MISSHDYLLTHMLPHQQSNFSELGWTMEGPALSCVRRERVGVEKGGEERERRRGQINTCNIANTHAHTHIVLPDYPS